VSDVVRSLCAWRAAWRVLQHTARMIAGLVVAYATRDGGAFPPPPWLGQPGAAHPTAAGQVILGGVVAMKPVL